MPEFIPDYYRAAVTSVRSKLSRMGRRQLLEQDEDALTKELVDQLTLPEVRLLDRNEWKVDKVEEKPVSPFERIVVWEARMPVDPLPRWQEVMRRSPTSFKPQPYEFPRCDRDCLVIQVEVYSSQAKSDVEAAIRGALAQVENGKLPSAVAGEVRAAVERARADDDVERGVIGTP